VRFWAWLRAQATDTEPDERVLLVGLALLGVGCALVAGPGWGLVATGGVLVAVSLGFRFVPALGEPGEPDDVEERE
jgi:hypothetical protein